MAAHLIREIEEKDNKELEKLIRDCLIEFGADHEGTAWEDEMLGKLSFVYEKEKERYWVALDEKGEILAGAGIGDLHGVEGVCELQKMYCRKEARGSGVSHQLMDRALDFASEHYQKCYLETLENMTAARRFYEKYGFERIYHSLGDTGHDSCDVRYLLDLNKRKEL